MVRTDIRNGTAAMNVTSISSWAARLLGLMLAILVLLFIVGEGFDPRLLTSSTGLMFVAFFTSVIGMLVLWRSRLFGGLIVTGGMAAFFATNFAISGQFPGGWVFPLCFVPGVLALTSWAVTRLQQRVP